MVKRYFRPFICAVCTALSVLFGAGNAAMYIAAAELPVETDAVQTETGGEEESGQNQETISETMETTAEQTESTETEPATEAVTEAPATETAATEAATETMPVAQETEIQEAKPQSQETLPENTPNMVAETGTDENETGTGSENGDPGQSQQTDAETGQSDGQEVTDGGIQMQLDKEEYALGDEIELTLDGFNDTDARKATFTIEMPAGMAFKEVKEMPGFAGLTPSLEYKDAEGNLHEYTQDTKPEDVKALVLSVLENGSGIVQEKQMVLKFTAVNRMDEDFKVTNTVVASTGQEKNIDSKVHIKIAGEVADVSMVQSPQAPIKGDEVRQTTDITYKMDADTMLTYTPDPGVDLLSLQFDPEGIFIGGNAVVTSSTGDTQIAITENLDLKSYAGITSIKLMPKGKAEKGVKNSIVATLLVREAMDTYTNSLSVVAGPEDNQIVSEFTQVFDIDYSSLEKPTLSYEGEKVLFGENMQLGFGGMGIHSYKDVKSLEYTVTAPEFATIREIKIPALSGASAVSVYVKEGKEESLLGEYKPGETVAVGKNGISLIRFTFALDGKDLVVEENGTITMASLNTKNRVNYFAFRASMNAENTDGKKMKTVSDILAVSFELYRNQEDTEKPPVETPPAENPPVQTPPVVETPETPADDEEDNESNYDKIKEEEEAKKQSIIDKTLERDQEAKERQKALLAERIASIRSSAIISSAALPDGGSESGDAQTPETFEDWLVKPIDESIVENLVPSYIDPIDEGLIENLVPLEG